MVRILLEMGEKTVFSRAESGGLGIVGWVVGQYAFV